MPSARLASALLPFAAAAFVASCPGTASGQDEPAVPPPPPPPKGEEELREYVRRLEERVGDLERDRDPQGPPPPKEAQSALEEAIRSITLSGEMEVLYSHNFRDGGEVPGQRGSTIGYNQLRGPDADVEGFSLQTVQLLADRPLADPGSTGLRVRANYGETSKVANADPEFDPGDSFDLREAYFAWRPKVCLLGMDHLDLAAGKFRSPIGFEVLENSENWLVTRNPIAVFGTPVTLTGLRATLPFAETVSANVYAVNGWDDQTDANDGKTGVLHLAFGRYELLSSQFQFLASYGSLEGEDDHAGDKRRLFELIWDGKLAESTEIALDAVQADSPDRDWWGVAAYVRQRLGARTKLALRVGTYADDTFGAGSPNVWDASLSLSHELVDGLTASLEFRHDWSDDDLFLDSSGDPYGRQDTLTASLVYKF